MRTIFRALLGTLILSSALFGQSTNVYLDVSAPKNWYAQITEAVTNKLNAIPDVQVVDKSEDAQLTVSVDVNSVSEGKDIVGYSMMALIYGTYDRSVLIAAFDELWGKSNDKDVKRMYEFMKYTASGNIFLAGTVHTHGPFSDIDGAYDQIAGKLKTKALPELRRSKKLMDDISSTPNGMPTAKF